MKTKTPTPKKKAPCATCKGEGWFTTNSGTMMCSDCRGKGRK
jgi:hypothetical protein